MATITSKQYLRVKERHPEFIDAVENLSITVDPTPVLRIGENTTTLTAQFEDVDEQDASEFTAVFKIRAPDDATELTFTNNITITDDSLILGSILQYKLQNSSDWNNVNVFI